MNYFILCELLTFYVIKLDYHEGLYPLYFKFTLINEAFLKITAFIV